MCISCERKQTENNLLGSLGGHRQTAVNQSLEKITHRFYTAHVKTVSTVNQTTTFI